MNRLRARLVGLAAAVGLLAIVAGLPAVLLAIGANPIPHTLPSLSEIVSALTHPDDGTLALSAIAVIAWIAWAFLTVSIATEVFSRLRGMRAPRLPGLRLPQSAARGLVSAAALLFISVPMTMQPSSADATPARPPIAAAAPAHVPGAAATQTATRATTATATPPAHTPARHGPVVQHTVRRGESLWSIAQAHLGSGTRYPEIAALNAGLLDGRPGFLKAGWVLTVPAHPDTQSPAGGHLYTVVKGDTLSEIAREHLGDAKAYPHIFEASRGITQPGGRHLSDPDVIDVGWTLQIPSVAAPTAAKPAPATTPPKPAPSGTTTSRSSNTPQTGPVTPRPTRPARDPDDGSAIVSAAPPGATEQLASPAGSTAPADNDTAPWILVGLTGGGVVLAGSLMLVLRQRRRAQFRARRPGRTIAVPPAALAPVEKTITSTGGAAAPTVELIDHALRRLAATHAATGLAMPALAAVELTSTHLTLHLSHPADLSPPWADTGERLHWACAISGNGRGIVASDGTGDTLGPLSPDQPAPYPLLVTLGAADTGAVWLLNCEQLGILSITGDPTYAQDFARYLAAELAMNPWSRDVRVDCVGICQEVIPMNPARVRFHPSGEDATADVLTDAVAMIERATHAGTDTAAARAAQIGDDLWLSRLLLVDAATGQPPALAQLLGLLEGHTGRTGAAVVLTGENTDPPGAVIHLTAGGRVRLPNAGLDLVAVGLTSDEAQGCAALLAHSEDTRDTDVPVDEDAEDGWRVMCNQAGALRTEHTLARSMALEETGEPVDCLLDAPDEDYLQAAATTRDDLEALAPRVPVRVRADVEDADPTLDADLQDWVDPDCPLPRLSLLGPVKARTRGAALAVANRKPWYTEILAYLATRPHGASTAQAADALGISTGRVRKDMTVLREWLGTNPRTGCPHLPEARQSAAAKDRGVGVYQVQDLLVDADLFRRLRVRGEARGPAGMSDLCQALTLVTGTPFQELRDDGGAWLYDGDRVDQHLLCAIVDVAHMVATSALREGDLDRARGAAELAMLAAPHEEIPRLDLAAVAAADGRRDHAAQIVRDQVCNRSDDGEAPTELSERTQTIIRSHDWLTRAQAAS